MLNLSRNSIWPLKTHQYDAKNRKRIVRKLISKKKVTHMLWQICGSTKAVLIENYNKQIF